MNQTQNDSNAELPVELQGILNSLEPQLQQELGDAIRTLQEKDRVPRIWQLESPACVLQGQNIAVSSKTGSGKTMIILIPLLARPSLYSLTISPLKSLMYLQVSLTASLLLCEGASESHMPWCQSIQE